MSEREDNSKSDDDELSMDEFVEGLRDLIDGMPAEWDRIGRLAVLFGACFHASDLSMEEAERAFARLKGATEWWNAHEPAEGEPVH